MKKTKSIFIHVFRNLLILFERLSSYSLFKLYVASRLRILKQQILVYSPQDTEVGALKATETSLLKVYLCCRF